MAKAFGSTNGKAIKNNHEAYTYKDGEQTLRLYGGVLPRYVYWVKTSNGKDIPIECLAFNRDKEKFDNLEVDHVQKYFPDKKCGWAYSINCIDPADGKSKVLNLKKKLFEQISTAAEDLGDPTDLDNGWDIVFKRVKTGPLAYNVEYTLQVLRCKKRSLTEEERKVVAESPSIDEKIVRPTSEEVEALCEKITSGNAADTSESENEAVNELG